MNPSTGSFLPSTKASQDWKETVGKGTPKRLLIQWSMRWFYLTSKASRAVRAEFWLSLRSFSSSSEARDPPRALTRRLPLLLRTKVPNNATFYVSMAISPPFLNVFSVFLFLSGIRFIGRLVLHPVPSGVRVKEAGILSLFPFVKCCVLGISMATHIRGHVNPAFWLCGFGIFLCVDSEWCGTFVTQSCNN